MIVDEGRESKFKVYRKWLADQDPAPSLRDYRYSIGTNTPNLFRALKDKYREQIALDEETKGVLEYFRDLLISLIDISLEPEFLPIFNLKMSLALKVLMEVIETEVLQEKITQVLEKDYEEALSYIWKILLSICQQNLILDTKRQQSGAEVPISAM